MASIPVPTFPPGFWASIARQHPLFKVELLHTPIESDQFLSDDYMDMGELLKENAPAILWMAKPMASAHTGMRPKGESVKLFGAWWKLEKLTEAKIRKEMELQAMTLDFGSTYTSPGTGLSSMRPRRVSVLELLTKAVDAAIREGISVSSIHSLVDNRLVVTTMVD